MSLREDANTIIRAAITAAMPDAAVRRALQDADFGDGRLVLIAAGKAAWQMAKAACDTLGKRIGSGVVVTKYDHSKGELPGLSIYEAGHPVPDENSFTGTQAAIDAVSGLSVRDTVLFLLSGGGSALFEKPLIPKEDLDRLTRELLASGADITEMNTVRKRFSAVKGGRFAELCKPARVFSVVLSDIIGDPLDMIASGPAYPDASTCEEALEVARKYRLTLTPQMEELIRQETPKSLTNVETRVTGSVRQLCLAAAESAKALGYRSQILTASLCCTARDAGSMLAEIARYHQDTEESLAFILGGETVVHLTGHGMGGRNQELALAAAPGISGFADTAIFSVGSDGTDGPTDAAGGYVDGNTNRLLLEKGYRVFDILQDNNAYHALKAAGGLVMTGPTGTNVNDFSVLLIRR